MDGARTGRQMAGLWPILTVVDVITRRSGFGRRYGLRFWKRPAKDARESSTRPAAAEIPCPDFLLNEADVLHEMRDFLTHLH